MNSPSFWHGTTVALVLSAAGAAVYNALEVMMGADVALRTTIAVAGFSYLLVLLHSSGMRVGRLVTVGVWLVFTALLCVGDPAVGFWLLAQVGMIWLVRCMVLHGSLLGALADAGLNALALAASLATALHTHSAFLTLWTFFLLQALYVLIPRLPAPSAQPDTTADGFEQAFRTAEAALRRLSIRN